MLKVPKLNKQSLFWLCLLLITITSIIVLWYFNYPYHNKNASLLSFIKIFFRELIILIIVAIVSMVYLVKYINKLFK